MPFTYDSDAEPYRAVSPWWPDANDPGGWSLPECPACGAWEQVEYYAHPALTYCVSCGVTSCVLHGKPKVACCPPRKR